MSTRVTTTVAGDQATPLVYQLPLSGLTGNPTDLFGTPPMQAFRIRDIQKFFGIPENTVRDWLKNQTRDPDPLPVINVGRSVLIPAEAFRCWLLRKGGAKQIVSTRVENDPINP